MFFRPATMRKLVIKRGDNSHLLIGPANKLNPCRLAKRRLSAVSGNHKTARELLAIRKRELGKPRRKTLRGQRMAGHQRDVGRCLNRIKKATQQMVVLHHLGRRGLPGARFAELQQHRPGFGTTAIGHNDFVHRLHVRGHMLPHPQGLEHAFGAGGNRRGAGIIIAGKRLPRIPAINDGHGQRASGPVPAKGEAGGQPIQRRADDNDIKGLAHDAIKNAHNPSQSRQSLFMMKNLSRSGILPK